MIYELQQAGTHTVHFHGSSLASGVYFYSLIVDGIETTKNMTLIR